MKYKEIKDQIQRIEKCLAFLKITRRESAVIRAGAQARRLIYTLRGMEGDFDQGHSPMIDQLESLADKGWEASEVSQTKIEALLGEGSVLQWLERQVS